MKGKITLAESEPLAAADDAAVIGHSRSSPACFAVVFDRHAPHIHRYLSRRAGRQAADDLVAETFLVAFAKRHRYDARQPDARPWLYGIATRIAAQHRRHETRWNGRRAVAPVDAIRPDHAERVVADVTAESMRGALRSAVARLSDGDRDVPLLLACEELTYEEVARALDIPVGTVRSRMHRARTSLRLALGETDAARYLQGDPEL